MKVKDILCINTYGGSLLIAAKKVGLPIRGSYEDVGFGSKIQALNFPEVPLLTKRSEWSEQDLSRTVVIAHPPCAGFSNQNKNNHKYRATGMKHMGVEGDAFACTIDVAGYAMGNGAAAVLIESVMPALEGARSVHDALADEHGYDVYRVLQKAEDFGVAQKRERFWCVFVRKGLRRSMDFWLCRTNNVTVARALKNAPVEEPIASDIRRLRQVLEVGKSKGLSGQKLAAIIAGEHGFGKIETLLKKVFALEGDPKTIAKEWTSRGYLTATPRLLDPDGLATTLLHDNLWVYEGKALSSAQYKILMGFPPRYNIPYASNAVRLYLSKGVCPPVAEWMLRTVIDNLEGHPPTHQKPDRASTVIAGDTVDLR